MGVQMRKKRYTYNHTDPKMMLAGEHTVEVMENMARGARKRKTLSDVFPMANSDRGN